MNTADSITILVNANVYAPAYSGLQSIVIAGDKIISVGDEPPKVSGIEQVRVIDLEGAMVTPGFIDAHTHITGGGGEAGFSTRVPPVPPSHFTRAGATTVVGLLGTDDVTRSTESLVAQVYALREEGLSAYCYTGGYHLPPTTLTGSVQRDIVFIEPVIAVGEVAISDHRSSQPTLNELLKVAAEAHVAHLMTGKAGVLHLHLGDGERGLQLVRDALDQSEIPARVFNPTHVNRRKELFDEACELTLKGCTVDITAFETGTVGYEPVEAVNRFMHSDYPQSQLTVSSDGGGCLPIFNSDGVMTSMDFASSQAMMDVFVELLNDGAEAESILPFFTSNVAKLLCLYSKGQIAAGADADLLIFNANSLLTHVMAMGQWHVFDEEIVKQGMFE